MSVIAWDGRCIAADQQTSVDGLRLQHDKLIRHGKSVVGTVGSLAEGQALIDWYMNSRDPATFPVFVAGESAAKTILIAVYPDSPPQVWECALPYTINEQFMAWGSGRDLAIGAMAAGATAEEAVEIACHFKLSCGIGVTTFDLEAS